MSRVAFGLVLIFYSGTLLFSQTTDNDVTADTLYVNQLKKDADSLTYINPDLAVEKLGEALTVIGKYKLPQTKREIYNSLGLLYTRKGEFKEALQNDLLALEQAKLAGDSLLIMASYNNIGDDHMNVANFDLAVDFFEKALIIAEVHEDKRVISTVNFNIGFVLKALRRFDEAKEHFYFSQEISREINDAYIETFAYNELGHLYFLIEEFDSAKLYLERAKGLVEKERFLDLKVDNLIKLSELYIFKNDLAPAISMLSEALGISHTMENKQQQASILNELARMYIVEGEFNQAQQVLNQSIEISQDAGNDIEIYDSYSIYSQLMEKMGDTASALHYLKKYVSLKDSIDEKLLNTRIANIRLQNEIDQRDFEISLLNTREKQQLEEIEWQKLSQNVMFVLLAMLLFLLITVYRSGLRRRRINALLEKHKEEVMTKNVELDELNKVKDKFISILAHDLRSPIRSLTAIINLATSKKMTEEELEKFLPEIKERMEQTSNLLDNLLEWVMLQMEKITVTKTSFDIHELVEKNLSLIRNMNNKEIEFKNKVAQYMVEADENMIDLALRNLLTNALKFTEEGEVRVSMEEREDSIIVSVCDTGPGLSEEEIESVFDENKMVSKESNGFAKGTGLGLKLTKEFIERNGGKIWVANGSKKGSVFEFSLPK